MKRFLILLMALASVPLVLAQNNTTKISSQGTSGAACAAINISPGASSTVGIQITGTWSGTLTPYVAIGNRTPTATQVTPTGSTTAQSTVSANGYYLAPVATATLFQICMTSYSSGTAVVDLSVSTGLAFNLFGSGGGGGGGSGTVTSVSFTGDGIVDNSTPSTAVTTSGTVAATAKTQQPNFVLAGPASGGATTPTFRALVSADIPNNAANTSGTAANLSGTPTLPDGTKATTQSPGDNSTKLATTAFVLANGSGVPLGTAGQLPVMNAGATAYAPVTLSQDCTITAAGVITCLKSNNVAFASGAFAAAYVLPTATSSVLGGVKPDGTSILNTAGAISVTKTSIGLGSVTNNAQVISVTGTSNQIASSGGTTPVLSITSPLQPPGNVTLASGNVLGFNSDSGFSRTAAATVAVGNGTNGDASGTINAASVNASSTVTVGAGAATVLGTSTNSTGFGCGAGTMVQTAGYAGFRCDLGTGLWKAILPGGGEYTSLMSYSVAPPAGGGTGVANTATLTLGSSNINLATQASGVVYNTTTTGALTPANFHQISAPIVATDTSASATTYTATTSPVLASLTTGDIVDFCGINQDNSGASTLAINGGSAIPIKSWQATALVAHDMRAGKCVILRYDGTNFELDTVGNAPSGSGTVTVVGGGSLGSTQLATGGGTTTIQTPCSTCTLDASGNLALAAGGSLKSVDTGTPGFTFATNKITANQPLSIGVTSNQIVLGTTTNLTTLTFPAPSGGITLTFPLTSQLMVGANSDTTTTHVLHATSVAGVGNFAAIAAGDLPGGAGQILAGATPALTATPALGTDNSVAGTLQLANGSANAHTIWGSGATTSNTINGFATAPTTGHLIDCTVTSTTCLLHDSGVVTANVVNASSPGVGIAHFAGSTQTVTSSLIVAADITSSTITHTQTDSTFPTLVASGTSAMGTSSISSGACATVVTTTASGALTSDNLVANPTADPTGVTGYAPSATGSLYIQAYITSGNVNFKVCNNTSGSLTPSALTMQWRVLR